MSLGLSEMSAVTVSYMGELQSQYTNLKCQLVQSQRDTNTKVSSETGQKSVFLTKSGAEISELQHKKTALHKQQVNSEDDKASANLGVEMEEIQNAIDDAKQAQSVTLGEYDQKIADTQTMGQEEQNMIQIQLEGIKSASSSIGNSK